MDQLHAAGCVSSRSARPPAEGTAGPDPWRPSEYTAFLLHTLQTRARRRVRGAVLEIGVGSGVVLAALAELGAERLVGTDIDLDALETARRLLARCGHAAELLVSDIWTSLPGRRFDLIVANPPHFAALTPIYPERPRSWSDGGTDGRRVLDPLLRGLRSHLAEDGHAIVMHSAFLDTARTRRVLAEEGLACRRLASMLMLVAPGKRAVMTPSVAAAAGRGSLQHLGGHCFARTDILEIARRESDGG